jgi:hypothetical protein
MLFRLNALGSRTVPNSSSWLWRQVLCLSKAHSRLPDCGLTGIWGVFPTSKRGNSTFPKYLEGCWAARLTNTPIHSCCLLLTDTTHLLGRVPLMLATKKWGEPGVTVPFLQQSSGTSVSDVCYCSDVPPHLMPREQGLVHTLQPAVSNTGWCLLQTRCQTITLYLPLS